MTTSKKEANELRRYTSVPSLLHLLQNKKITLLSPATWDDKNDAFFMSQYKQRKKLKSVLALCFTLAYETYHHWRVFTHGSDGVCIRFKRDKLLPAFKPIANVRAEEVKYERIDVLQKHKPPVDDLPFLKRLPYKPEREFRLVYSDTKKEVEAQAFDIDLTCIDRVQLSPWMPKSLAEAVEVTINSIPDCANIKVKQSTLLETEKWKNSATS
jgi:hypothetical protein